MPRKNLIAGNWKMNNTIPEAVVLLAQETSNRMERDYLSWWTWAACPLPWISASEERLRVRPRGYRRGAPRTSYRGA